MEALSTLSSISSLHIPNPLLQSNYRYSPLPTSPFPPNKPPSRRSNLSFRSRVISPIISAETDSDVASAGEEEKFDWYSQWYPVMPVCDLDKRIPHAKKVLGIDVVVWWDKNENAWKVFDDMCPHRLAPLSEGRIDQLGRLQCVYHGWCFDGSGNCKLIPQAPLDGPPVHTNKKACVAAYPTVLHHEIVWFWPSSDPQYKDIIEKKKPPFIPELDDPSFTKLMGNRDINYGYDVLVENLMDPAHVPYAHYGLMQTKKPEEKRDREGGRPLEYNLKEERIDGFDAEEVEYGRCKFVAPCIASVPGHIDIGPDKVTLRAESVLLRQCRKTTFVFMCVPVSPGKSRLIWAFPRNFDHWVDKVVPRWFVHLNHNMVLDSDLNLLHVEEQRIKEAGGNRNWHKACFVPTKSDALVVGFRKWLNRYSDGEVDWRGTPAGLPPTPPREQLMDRYWTHVANCSSCSRAYKNLKALESFLVALSVGSVAIAAATKEGITMLAIMAMICFAASRWLARYIDTNFRYHDYNHSFPPPTPFARFSKLIGVGL
ncbi:Protochlorophyllide-dependent translocon component 52, chloroplastic [Linum grandiflorum]